MIGRPNGRQWEQAATLESNASIKNKKDSRPNVSFYSSDLTLRARVCDYGKEAKARPNLTVL